MLPHEVTWAEFLGRAAFALLAAGVFVLFYLLWTRDGDDGG